MKRILYGVIGALCMTGCTSDGYWHREDLGAVVGGLTGAFVGSHIGDGSGQVAATAVGAIIGVMIGSDIGRQLDKADRDYYANATYQALEHGRTGKSVAWRNPDSGNYGATTVKHTQPTTLSNGARSYCREYQTAITVGGQTQTGYGTACRQPDGTWKLVS